MPRQPGYLTQCDRHLEYGVQCPNSARLLKPARWRCEACTKKFGPIPKG